MGENGIEIPENAKDLFRATAHANVDVAQAALKAVVGALNEPLRKGVFDAPNLNGIFTPEVLEPGATASYPLDIVRPGTEDLEFSATVLPKHGTVPDRHVEADEVHVPTFAIESSIDWNLDIARHCRFNLVQRALEVYRSSFVRKINEDGWHTVLGAADSRGLVVVDTVAEAGQFTKELVSKARTAMTRNAGGNGNAGQLTDVFTSMEASEDIRAYDLSEIDDVTRRIILNSEGGMTSMYGTRLHFMTEFGVGQEYQQYMATTLGRVVTAGHAGDQEFAIGLDLSTRDSFVMPVRETLQTYPSDPTYHRRQKAGVYGWQKHGFAVLDNRRCLILTF